MHTNIVFGPVPSRRLGRSLGINNIPPKVCTYACVYCQLGRAIHMQTTRKSFYSPEEIERKVEAQLSSVYRHGETVNYLCFVPDGEPSLDANIGESIRRLQRFGVPVAMISNGSLLSDARVREELLRLDWMSIKVDAAYETLWRSIDRPHKALAFSALTEGARKFAHEFHGTLTTETMLIDTMNTEEEHIEALAEHVQRLNPEFAYLAVPTRPPAEPNVRPADEKMLTTAFRLFSLKLPRVELLTGYEGNAFSSTGDAAHDLLSITAVHPMREDAVQELLRRDGAQMEVVERLVHEGFLRKVEYRNQAYYLRSFRNPRRNNT